MEGSCWPSIPASNENRILDVSGALFVGPRRLLVLLFLGKETSFGALEIFLFAMSAAARWELSSSTRS